MHLLNATGDCSPDFSGDGFLAEEPQAVTAAAQLSATVAATKRRRGNIETMRTLDGMLGDRRVYGHAVGAAITTATSSPAFVFAHAS